MRLRYVVALVAGCHGSAPAKPPGDPPCAKVAHHWLDLMMKDPPPEAAKAIVDMVVERCEHDAWSAEAQQCMIAMKAIDDPQCAELLTVRQRDALTKEIDDKLPRPKEDAKRAPE